MKASDQYYSTFAGVVNAVYGVLILTLSTNYLSPEDYGSYFYSLSLISFARIALFPGFEKTIPGYSSKNRTNIVHGVGVLSSKYGLIGVIFLLLYAVLFENNDNVRMMLVLGSVLFIPYFLFQRILQIMTGEEKFYEIFKLRSVISLMLLIINYLSLAIFNVNIILYFFINISSVAILHYLAYRHYVLNNKEIDTVVNKIILIETKEAFNSGKKVTFSGIPAMIIEPMFVILIGNYLGMKEVSVFVIAKNIIGSGGNMIKAMMRPLVVHKYKMNEDLLIFKDIAKLLFFGLLLYAIALIVSYYLLPYLLGIKYIESIELIYILALGFIVTPLGVLLHQNILFNSYVKEYAIALNTVLLVKLVLYVIIAPYFGIFGIVYINLAMVYFYVAMNALLLYRMNANNCI
jgi:O-antigen/teichoic acid export membrane protein